eukprot:scaffold20713_cov53-Phaeocystis_antarctica.AAC.1
MCRLAPALPAVVRNVSPRLAAKGRSSRTTRCTPDDVSARSLLISAASVAARKARSRVAAALAPGLKADAWASIRSKHVHGEPSSSRVDAASVLEVAFDKARTVNSHAWIWTRPGGFLQPVVVAPSLVRPQAAEGLPRAYRGAAEGLMRQSGWRGRVISHRHRVEGAPAIPCQLYWHAAAHTSAADWRAYRDRRRRWGIQGAAKWRFLTRGREELPRRVRRGMLDGRGCCCSLVQQSPAPWSCSGRAAAGPAPVPDEPSSTVGSPGRTR